MCVEAVLKASRTCKAPRSSRVLSSATNALKAALKGPGREGGRDRRERCSQYVSQNTARIDRMARNVVFCRTFSRTVLLLVVDRQWIITDRSRKYQTHIARIEFSYLQVFFCLWAVAVGAGDIL
jgi:hypothetical protein